MDISREILQFLHYNPLSSRDEIAKGTAFEGSDTTLKRHIAALVKNFYFMSYLTLYCDLNTAICTHNKRNIDTTAFAFREKSPHNLAKDCSAKLCGMC